MALFIGLSSQKQMAKNTVAGRLIQNFASRGETWREKSFAGPVKEIFCQAFDKDLDFIERWKEVPYPPPGMDRTVRDALIFIGDGFRSVDPRVWIKKAFGVDPRRLIFTDARYFNETKEIKEGGGTVALIYRPDKLNFMESASESQIRPILQWCHQTGREGPIKEWEEYHSLVRENADPEFIKNLSLYDYFLLNDGTLEDLYEKIDSQLFLFLLSIKS